MAEQNTNETNGVSWEAAKSDHRAVYSGFLTLSKVAIFLIIFILILMAIFLV